MRDTIAFIGGGNMATSLVGGLIADGLPASQIWVAEPDEERRRSLVRAFAVQTTADNREAARRGDVLVLAVKPQILRQVAEDLSESVQAKHPLVISVAAGVRESDLRPWLGGDVALVRAMPNTPALVRSGATALFANDRVSGAQRELAETILRAVGVVLWLSDESLMDAVTAVSGSGPAYFFLVIEALEKAAITLGLSTQAARLLTVQTALGAAKMALESEEDVDKLLKRVASPGGTTEAALRVLDERGLGDAFLHAVEAAHRRSIQLAERFGAK